MMNSKTINNFQADKRGRETRTEKLRNQEFWAEKWKSLLRDGLFLSVSDSVGVDGECRLPLGQAGAVVHLADTGLTSALSAH